MTRATAWHLMGVLACATLFAGVCWGIVTTALQFSDLRVAETERAVREEYRPLVQWSQRLAEGRVACVDGIAVGNPVPSEVNR